MTTKYHIPCTKILSIVHKIIYIFCIKYTLYAYNTVDGYNIIIAGSYKDDSEYKRIKIIDKFRPPSANDASFTNKSQIAH